MTTAISLRDYFAGQALAVLVTNAIAEGRWAPPHLGLASDCYELADALLAVRNGPPRDEAEVIPGDVATSRGGLALT
jgi:hypothetical protein